MSLVGQMIEARANINAQKPYYSVKGKVVDRIKIYSFDTEANIKREIECYMIKPILLDENRPIINELIMTKCSDTIKVLTKDDVKEAYLKARKRSIPKSKRPIL